MTALGTRAPAKINLTLHVLGRRADGYHALESLVVFAGVADALTLVPGPALVLDVSGPRAGVTGPSDENLIVKAARHLAARVPDLRLGRFHLIKRLPAAAGIGGGSSDAAAALRLLARANGIDPNHQGLIEAARATGADVPVCLDPRARMMRGAGEEVGPPLALPRLHAVLINPGVAVPTPAVFKALALAPGEDFPGTSHPATDRGLSHDRLHACLASARNDLETPARALAPEIDEALELLRKAGAALARMSGSGATVFGLFADCGAAARAAKAVAAARPAWWVKATVLR